LKRRLSTSLAVGYDYAEVKDPAVDLIYLAAEQWALASSWTLIPPSPVHHPPRLHDIQSK
jgi:hypothetical protein